MKITVNGKRISFNAHPSSYIAIKRHWKKGDVVEVLLPMHNHIEHLPNVPELHSNHAWPYFIRCRNRYTGSERFDRR